MLFGCFEAKIISILFFLTLKIFIFASRCENGGGYSSLAQLVRASDC